MVGTAELMFCKQAASVSMSFLIPFAIYGVNLFNGQLVQCNDDDFEGNLDYRTSILTISEIHSSSSVGEQPEDYIAPENGLFFVVFNLLGAVFVLTLFVSVFMRNYTEQTGVAFLTAEQRSWLELRKLLRQISPSKRSFETSSHKWKMWCYRVAVKKHGRWARCITTILMLHLLLLVLEYYPEPKWWDLARGELSPQQLFSFQDCSLLTSYLKRVSSFYLVFFTLPMFSSD